MKNHIDIFCELFNKLRDTANKNQLEICATRESIQNSNGAIKKAVLGEKVKSVTVDSKQVIVDLSDLKSSVYFLQITDSKNQTSIQKVVKE